MAAMGRPLKAQKPQEMKANTSELPLEEQIRQRAHEIYLQRGGDAGSDMDDWLQAEDEIRQKQGE
jgi:hypothetical protein